MINANGPPVSILFAILEMWAAGAHLLANFDWVSTPTRKKNAVARFYRSWYYLPIFVGSTWTDGDDRRFRERTRCRG
jgi:hypothetical protein